MLKKFRSNSGAIGERQKKARIGSFESIKKICNPLHPYEDKYPGNHIMQIETRNRFETWRFLRRLYARIFVCQRNGHKPPWDAIRITQREQTRYISQRVSCVRCGAMFDPSEIER